MSAARPTTGLLTRLCDDAAVFPPGNMPLRQAVPAHLRHLRSPHAGLVGPLVLAAKDLCELADLAVDGPEPLELAVTVALHVRGRFAAVGNRKFWSPSTSAASDVRDPTTLSARTWVNGSLKTCAP